MQKNDSKPTKMNPRSTCVLKAQIYRGVEFARIIVRTLLGSLYSRYGVGTHNEVVS